MILFQWILKIVVVAFWLSTATASSILIKACTTGNLTLQCHGFTNVRTIAYIEWRIRVGDKLTNHYHCLMSDDGCTDKGCAPEGFKVLSVSKKNITIERSEENGPINHVKISCEVNRDSSTASDSYEIKFTVKCVRAVEGRDLNFTRILQEMVSCERVSTVNWILNESKFACCDSCQCPTNHCERGSDGHSDEVSLDFRRRLRFTGGVIILTYIQGNDDRREINVTYDIEEDSGAKRSVGPRTIRILVENARHFSSFVVTNTATLVMSTSPKSLSRSCVSSISPTIIYPEHVEHKPTSSALATNTPVLPMLTVITVIISALIRDDKKVHHEECQNEVNE